MTTNIDNEPLRAGWCVARLGEICEWRSGGTPNRTESSYFDGEVPWATISDLNDGTVSTTKERISQAGLANSAAKVVPAGSVLVALYGSIGKLGIAAVSVATNQAIACAIPEKDGIDSTYLFYFLRLSRLMLGEMGTGVTQKNIYLSDLKAFRIPLAPRREQSPSVNVSTKSLRIWMRPHPISWKR